MKKILTIVLSVILGLGVGIGGTLLALQLIDNQNRLAEPNPEPTNTSEPSAQEPTDEEVREVLLSVATRQADDPAAIGAVDAPVVMIEFADYRCPYCVAFGKTTLPKIVQEYVDSGKLRIEWRDFAVFGNESIAGAIAARAAGNQGMFWEYQKAIYDYAPAEGRAVLTKDILLTLAKKAEIPDLKKFETDLTDAELELKVQTDTSFGKSLGVSSTPTFIIGGSGLAGAQPFDVFESIIEQELKLAESN